MKTKLEMAHEYLIKIIEVAPDESTKSELVSVAWDYADLMQEEADKRENSVSQELSQEEWQPDWSQSPKWANWWAMDESGESYYFKSKPEMLSTIWMSTGNGNVVPTQSNYQGSWKKSLRERP